MSVPKDAVTQAEYQLFSELCEEAKRQFDSMSSKQRWKFLQRFRTIVTKPKLIGFDGEKAKSIRQSLGLSRTKLILKEGWAEDHDRTKIHSMEVLLLRSENGESNPFKMTTNDNVVAYREWLLKNGYPNPTEEKGGV